VTTAYLGTQVQGEADYIGDLAPGGGHAHVGKAKPKDGGDEDEAE
jgi:hypothetical protein